MSGVQWEGMDEFQAALHKYPNVVNKTARETLYVEGERIMTHVKRSHLVPIDLGTLVNSAFVDKPVQTILGKISVTLGFGGQASAYALAVHEHPSGHSPPSWSGGVTFKVGGPKFLSNPVNERRKIISKRLSAAIVAALRKATP